MTVALYDSVLGTPRIDILRGVHRQETFRHLRGQCLCVIDDACRWFKSDMLKTEEHRELPDEDLSEVSAFQILADFAGAYCRACGRFSSLGPLIDPEVFLCVDCSQSFRRFCRRECPDWGATDQLNAWLAWLISRRPAHLKMIMGGLPFSDVCMTPRYGSCAVKRSVQRHRAREEEREERRIDRLSASLISYWGGHVELSLSDRGIIHAMCRIGSGTVSDISPYITVYGPGIKSEKIAARLKRMERLQIASRATRDSHEVWRLSAPDDVLK